MSQSSDTPSSAPAPWGDAPAEAGAGSAPARALVIGAHGAIGAALVAQLRADARFGEVIALSRQSQPAIDHADEASIGAAAQAVRAQTGGASFARIVVATGTLHGPQGMPEKRLAELNYASLEQVFRINTFGPALLLRHFAPMLDKQHGVMALLSAKVGSIGDNRLGGWYGYRASKAALNMLIRTASIELRRTHPGACVAALHPGTVKSALSRPFRGDEIGVEPALAAQRLLQVIDGLGAEDNGGFFSWDGQVLPW
ncbi:MAG: SDR family NAD(P)-dependent oxidoreductase [Burkholderiaceae bacterium]